MSDEDLLIRSRAETAPAGAVPMARALPANIEAEAAFIGAVLIDNKVMEELATPLRPEHFFEPVHQRIFERIITLLDRNSIVTRSRSSRSSRRTRRSRNWAASATSPASPPTDRASSRRANWPARFTTSRCCASW